MLLLFFFFPHNWATASDFRNLKTPSVRSSHLISPGFRSGFRRMSLMNSHKWVPLGSVETQSGDSRAMNNQMISKTLCKKKTPKKKTYCAFWLNDFDWKIAWCLSEKKKTQVSEAYSYFMLQFLIGKKSNIAKYVMLHSKIYPYQD